MKSINCISTTGRIPMCDAPAAAPTNPASEIGVSMTRFSPYFAISPSVTLNAPPYAPMSSPMQNTLLSRSISSKSASRIASRYVISAIESPPPRGALVFVDRGADARAIPQWLHRRRIRVHALERIRRLGGRRLLGQVGCDIDLRGHARIDRIELRLIDLQLLEQHAYISVDRIILAFPPRNLALRDVRLIVVLRVPLATIRHELDERDALAAARAIDCLARDIVRREHIVAVGAHTRNAVRHRLVLELLHRALLRVRRRVGVAVVFDDDDEGTALHCGEVDPLVERARRCRPIADVDHADALLAAKLERQCHARHHRDHVTEMRDLADEAAHGIAEVNVQLAAACGRIALRHVLTNDLQRLRAPHKHRAEVANERAEDVALAAIEREGAADRIGLLPQRSKKPANDLRLPVEVHEPLLERAREPHPVVQLDLLFERQRVGRTRWRTRSSAGRSGHQYAAASLCAGSASRCTRTKKRFTLRSRRLSPS